MPLRRMPLVFRALALFLASFPLARLSVAEPVEARTISGAPRAASASAISRIPLRPHYRQMVASGAVPADESVQRQVTRTPATGLRRGWTAWAALAAAAVRHGAQLRVLLVRAGSLAPTGLSRPTALTLGTPYPHRAGALLASIQVRAPCRA